jgi:hypothetical protein
MIARSDERLKLARHSSAGGPAAVVRQRRINAAGRGLVALFLTPQSLSTHGVWCNHCAFAGVSI